MYPKKTILDLNTVIEDGIFVISVTLISVVEGENWWFPSTVAKKIQNDGLRSVNNPDCFEYIFHLTRRYVQFFVMSYMK